MHTTGNTPPEQVDRAALRRAPVAGAPMEAGPGHEAPIQLRLLSDPCCLEVARAMVEAFARRVGCPERSALELTLAIDESLANVIRHGYGFEPGRPIWISLWNETQDGSGELCAIRVIRVVMEDEAPQVEAQDVLESAQSSEPRTDGGRGIKMIRTCLDQMSWEPRGERGMRLTLIKKFVPVQPGASHSAGHTTPGAADQGGGQSSHG